MGWTGHYTNRPSEEVVREELSYGGYNTIVANRGAKYWVLERDGLRFAVTVIVKRRPGEVMTKIISEDMGSYDYGFPLAFLDLLGEPLNDYSARWREGVRKYHADKKAKPTLKKGDTVLLAEPIEFSDGRKRDRLTYLGGYRFRDEYGQQVRLSKNWRTRYAWTIAEPALVV
jgi:hypothetical protein